MTKQEFLNLGLSDDLATKAEEASKKELETYIPKTRFDEVNEAKKKAENEVKERDTQLETVKKSAGDNEELKKQIQTLQEENKTAREKSEAELKELKLTNAIKLSIAGKAQDEDIVAGLFDRTKLILGDDGKVTGLDEQLKTIQTEKAFLFKGDQTPPKPGFVPVGGNPPAAGNGGQGNISLKDALAAKFSQQ